MREAINKSRVTALTTALRLVPPEALEASELADPQYRAIARLVRRHSEKAVAIVVANAVVSYRIPKHGEDYWLDYSSFWEDKPPPHTVSELLDRVIEFLVREKVAVLQQKVGRLQRARSVLEALLEDPLRYRSLTLLYDDLVRSLRGPRYQKTIAFAAKMAYYTYKALGVSVEGLQDIPVPLDRRFALLTATSGLLSYDPDTIYSRFRSVAEAAWRLVSDASGIPPARLDTLLWLPARGIERLVAKGLIGHARDEYAHHLLYYTGGRLDVKTARRIAEEVLYTVEWLTRRQ